MPANLRSSKTEMVLLVDENDRPLGTMEKLAAHRLGRLHRAISVFIFNSKGEFLLQQRAFGKYHSAGLWSNTSCSHPRPGEDILAAAHRRLWEEMGLKVKLEHRFSFLYHAKLGPDMTEHEYDHVFFGLSDELPVPDPGEAASFRYVSPENLLNELRYCPEAFSAWFKLCIDRMMPL